MNPPSGQARRRARRRGELLTRTSPVRVRLSSEERSGRVLTEAELLERVGYLAALVQERAEKGVKHGWSRQGLARLTAPGQPQFAYRALERAQGRLLAPRGRYYDSRALWLAEEVAGRLLRSQLQAKMVIEALIAGRPLPPGTDSTQARNLRRELGNYARREGHPARSFLKLRPTPPVVPGHALPLASTDKQFCSWLAVGEEKALLRLKLPLKAKPRQRSDWAWHLLKISLPEQAQARLAENGELLRPTLRLSSGRLLCDLPVSFPKPALLAASSPPRAALAFDWGERRLLTATDVWRGLDGELRTSGRPLFFDAKGAQAKLGRLRKHAGRVQGRIRQLESLRAGRDDNWQGPERDELERKLAVLSVEKEHIWAKYAQLAQQLAHAAARWGVEQGKAQGLPLFLHEDLKSLEARFPNRGLNGRINHQVRGLVFRYLDEKAAEEGLATGAVAARGTSSGCPRCLSPLRHQKAPDDPRRGRGWSVCRHCGYQGDRDQAAAESIGAVGLSPGPREPLRRSARPALTAVKNKSRRGGQERKQRQERRQNRETAAIAPKLQTSTTSTTLLSRRPSDVGSRPSSAVRPGGTPRLKPSLEDWRQRPSTHSPRAPRALSGMQQGFTGSIRLSPERRPLTLARAKNPAPA